MGDYKNLSDEELAEEVLKAFQQLDNKAAALETSEEILEQIKSYGIDLSIDQEFGGKLDFDMPDTNIIEVAAIFSEILEHYVETDPHLKVDARLTLYNPGHMPAVEETEEPTEPPGLFAINKRLLILHYNWESAILYYFREVAPELFNGKGQLYQYDERNGETFELDDVSISINDDEMTVKEAMNQNYISIPAYIEF